MPDNLDEHRADDSISIDLRPHHCALSIPDLEASIAWYECMLGFTEEQRFTVPELSLRAAFVRRGDFRIELFQLAGAAPLPAQRRDPNEDLLTHGTKHMAFQVSDVRAAMASLKRRGVDVAWDVFELDGVAAAFIRDNAGNLIELFQPPN